METATVIVQMEGRTVIAHVYRDLIVQKGQIATVMGAIAIAIVVQIIVIVEKETVIAVKEIVIVSKH